MTATCVKTVNELTCGVAAFGRCQTCSDAFCVGHAGGGGVTPTSATRCRDCDAAAFAAGQEGKKAQAAAEQVAFNELLLKASKVSASLFEERVLTRHAPTRFRKHRVEHIVLDTPALYLGRYGGRDRNPGTPFGVTPDGRLVHMCSDEPIRVRPSDVVRLIEGKLLLAAAGQHKTYKESLQQR